MIEDLDDALIAKDRADEPRESLDEVRRRLFSAATATEVIDFLSQEPTREEVLAYHASEKSQARLRRLLALNAARQLSEEETRELQELQEIEHILVMLKAQLAGKSSQGDLASRSSRP